MLSWKIPSVEEVNGEVWLVKGEGFPDLVVRAAPTSVFADNLCQAEDLTGF
ncbi:hypothetical protein ACD591_15155 [Rufibacter glacialis]|uniref:Uncharacterized protein n=1 Tax=Rufibacter glacialis TaxID=1259555 RepID=A0ABV4RHM7_9BACT|nr:hypothetical protein [Rufibacter glacialis]GGK56995.1 hypothetical protein GCM10011405_01380 [Rufibacter glacialis]